MSWMWRVGRLLSGCAVVSVLFAWGVPKPVKPYIAPDEEPCGAVYRLRDGAGAHVRPWSWSRRAEVARLGAYVASCVQEGPWHGVRRVENDCVSEDADASCTIGWIHEDDLVLFAG